MRTVRAFGRRLRIHASAWTLALHEAEFGDDATPLALRLLASREESGGLARVTLAHADEEAALRLLWAMAKTADPRLDSFRPWRERMARGGRDAGAEGWLAGLATEAFHGLLAPAGDAPAPPAGAGAGGETRIGLSLLLVARQLGLTEADVRELPCSAIMELARLRTRAAGPARSEGEPGPARHMTPEEFEERFG